MSTYRLGIPLKIQFITIPLLETRCRLVREAPQAAGSRVVDRATVLTFLQLSKEVPVALQASTVLTACVHRSHIETGKAGPPTSPSR